MQIILLLAAFVCYTSCEPRKQSVDIDGLGDTLEDCKETPSKELDCEAYKDHTNSYRTINGSCNNLKHTLQGIAGSKTERYIPAVYFDKHNLDVPLGSPLLYHTNTPTSQEVAKGVFQNVFQRADKCAKLAVSALHMTFGQLLDHDMDLSKNGGCNKPDCQAEPEYPCQPIQNTRCAHTKCQKFARSFAACQPENKQRETREQVNVITSYIDGSMVYGNGEEIARTCRENDGTGRLRMVDRSGYRLLPNNPDNMDRCRDNPFGCYLAGDGRVNEHIGLVTLHTLFVMEHNRIVKELADLNPDWDGDKLYQETRKIVGAIIQHIAYEEYIPTIANLKPYQGYNEHVDTSIKSSFATAAFRYGHSQIANTWSQLDTSYNQAAEPVPLQHTFFNNELIEKNGIYPTLMGLVGNTSDCVDKRFADGVFEKLFIEPKSHGHANLAAINIERGRDHGLPSYNDFREFCGLKRANKFHDLRREIKSKRARKSLQKVYKNIENHVDLFAAGILEDHLPGLLVGPTFECIIRKQFEEVRDGDRYYYTRPGVFSDEQLHQIKKTSMSQVICNNVHSLVSIQEHAFKAHHPKHNRPVCPSPFSLSAWKEHPTTGAGEYY